MTAWERDYRLRRAAIRAHEETHKFFWGLFNAALVAIPIWIFIVWAVLR